MTIPNSKAASGDSCTGTGVGFPKVTQASAVRELPQAAPDHNEASCKL